MPDAIADATRHEDDEECRQRRNLEDDVARVSGEPEIGEHGREDVVEAGVDQKRTCSDDDDGDSEDTRIDVFVSHGGRVVDNCRPLKGLAVSSPMPCPDP